MTDKIQSLTPEQEAKLPFYREKWIKIGLATGPADFDKAREALKAAYRVAGLEPPPDNMFLHMQSPVEAVKYEREHGMGGLEGLMYGNASAGWLSFYDVMDDLIGVDCSILHPLMELALHAGWCWVYDDRAIITDRPDVIKLDDAGNLHCEDGPAIQYKGYDLFAINGVVVPEKVIMAPETLTKQEVTTERNAEVRRVMIDRYGGSDSNGGKYMEDMGARAIGAPFRGNQLYEIDVELDQGEVTLARVRAINSTPEPDGTSKIYWLKVPPGMSCAQEALAEIHPDPFRKHWRDYSPQVET